MGGDSEQQEEEGAFAPLGRDEQGEEHAQSICGEDVGEEVTHRALLGGIG